MALDQFAGSTLCNKNLNIAFSNLLSPAQIKIQLYREVPGIANKPYVFQPLAMSGNKIPGFASVAIG